MDEGKIVRDAFEGAEILVTQEKRKSLKEMIAKLRELTGGYWDNVKCVCDALGRDKCSLNCPEHEDNKICQ